MSEWQPMDTAPMDGTAIQAEIPGNGSDNVICFQMGLVDSDGNDCGGWCFAEENQEPPDDWTDGWCWEVNEDGNRSTQPTRWKPLPDLDALTGCADDTLWAGVPTSALRDAAQGMSAFGQDPQGLEAKPASPVAESDAPKTSRPPETPSPERA